jgi:hypothetical protein
MDNFREAYPVPHIQPYSDSIGYELVGKDMCELEGLSIISIRDLEEKRKI